jgi:transcription antitermination factor NusG
MNGLEWFAVLVKPRFEKSVAMLLRIKGYEELLPCEAEEHQWSDRCKTLEVPLFPRYVFCRFRFTERVPVLNTPGVVRIVGFGRTPTPIPKEEILALQHLVSSGVPARRCPYFGVGDEIRIRRGALAGLQGTFVEVQGSCRVVVSIHLLQRSVYTVIDRDNVERIAA